MIGGDNDGSVLILLLKVVPTISSIVEKSVELACKDETTELGSC